MADAPNDAAPPGAPAPGVPVPAAADTAYAAVVTRYPQSSRAPTALYKRARARLAAGRRPEARALFEEVVRRYPRSDEAALAREALRAGG